MTIHASTSVLESPNRFAEHFRTAIEAASSADLDGLARKVWAAHGAGGLSDGQAQQLAELIQRRRGPRPAAMLSGTAAAPRYFIQRSPEQRSPDRRASILRRREHAATGPLPPSIASTFTVGEIAVLRVVADEFLAHGACDRSVNELSARAGVCRSIVKQAVKYAEADGLITVLRRPRSGRKHLTNIIHIVRADWLAWLDKGRRKAYAIAACYRAKPDFRRPRNGAPEARGLENKPPRSQVLRNTSSDPVDKSGEKGNRTAAGRRRL
jgi:DNA-binding MarR family transcriptional regulator